MKARRKSDDVAEVRTEIRVWITRRGLTHSELAARMGHAPSWVSKRLGATPTVELTMSDLFAFAEALDVPASTFLRVEDPSPSATINYRKSA